MNKWLEITNLSTSKTSEVLIYDKIGKTLVGEDGIAAKEFGEALKGIPSDHEIKVRINSRGGNVWDGMAIYNMLQARKDKVTCIVDGLAASISAIIACAGKKTICNKGGSMMIHPPSALPFDSINAKEARALADKLDIHAQAIASVLAQKTGKTKEAMLAKMKEGETWMTAEEAKAFGLADEIADESRVSNTVQNQSQKFMPIKYLNIQTNSDSVKNACVEISLNVGKGGERSFENAADRSRRVAEIYAEARDKILPVMNAAANNAIDPGLKRVLILNETVRDFAVRVLPLRLLCTVFENVPLQGTDEVEVPYYTLQTAASSDFTEGDNAGGGGYQFGQATNTSAKKITVNKRKYQPLDYSSSTFQRQPFFSAARLGKINAEKLGVDILTDILSVITLAKYGAAVKNIPIAGYTSDDVIDLKGIATKANWPDQNRVMIVDSDLETVLQKDTAYKLALNIGTADVIQKGKFPNISGFDFASMPNFPTNGENLVGIIAFASAIAAAFAPVAPAAGVRHQLVAYEVATEPATGISLNYRHWGVAQQDRDYEVIESAYGYSDVITAALKRLTKP